MKAERIFILFLVATNLVFYTKAQQTEKVNYHKIWYAGIGTGSVFINRDVRASFPPPGWAAFVRKPFAKWFSLQVSYHGGIAKGLNLTPAFNYAKNSVWAKKYNAPVLTTVATGGFELRNSTNGQLYTEASADPVYYNYRTLLHQLSLQTRFSHAIKVSKTKIGIYAVLGIGALKYTAKVDALSGNGNTYVSLFRTINSQGSNNKKMIKKELKTGLDGVYETIADQDKSSQKINQIVQGGIGIHLNITPKIQIATEYLVTRTNQSLLDGQRWNEAPPGDAVLMKYFDGIRNVGVMVSYQF
jgi:OmpA-OmpF porin, OOP family